MTIVPLTCAFFDDVASDTRSSLTCRLRISFKYFPGTIQFYRVAERANFTEEDKRVRRKQSLCRSERNLVITTSSIYCILYKSLLSWLNCKLTLKMSKHFLHDRSVWHCFLSLLVPESQVFLFSRSVFNSVYSYIYRVTFFSISSTYRITQIEKVQSKIEIVYQKNCIRWLVQLVFKSTWYNHKNL